MSNKIEPEKTCKENSFEKPEERKAERFKQDNVQNEKFRRNRFEVLKIRAY